MNHTVLARKWRPKKFADLVGQKSTVTILQNIIATNRLHHAYLLTGTRGVGKTTIARIIAKALNCLNLSNSEPCGACDNCNQIDIGRMIDVIEIDAASNTGVDNIREVIENAQYAPTSGKYKIYIIDEVHMLSKSAFNAMLKTLEEPPAHVVFILATTDPHKVPITILSRCLQLKLRNLAIPEIERHLADILTKENVGSEPKALELIATAANGSMRDALSLTDQAIAFANGTITLAITQQMLGISDDGSILALLQAIETNDSARLVNICQELNNMGANLENLLEQINYALFQIGLAQLSPQPQLSTQLQQLASSISLQSCQLYFEISNLGLEQIRKIDNKYPIFVMTLLRMIAFSIGSNQQKQIIVTNSNCQTNVVYNDDTINDAISNRNENNNPESNSLQNKLAKPQDTSQQFTENYPVNLNITDNKQSSNNLVNIDLVNEEPITKHDAPHYETQQQNNKEANNKEIPPWDQEDSQIRTTQQTTDVNTANDAVAIDLVDEQSLNANIDNHPSSSLASAAEFDGNWLEFVTTIDLNTINPAIATVLKTSHLNSNMNGELQLSINDKFQNLVTRECVDSIEQMLWQRYAQHFDLSFNFTKEEQDQSLSSHQANQAKMQQQQAEESIHNDPIIQDLVSNFSAKILPNSIKPI